MRKGYSVLACENALDALKLVQEKNIDLIICDIRMPQMNGPEFYFALSKQAPAMCSRIIFTSGDCSSTGNLNFIKLSNAPLLPKPFELNKLLNIVQEKLNQLNQ